MDDYIKREEYCEKYCRCNNDYCNRQSCPIWKAPAADVVPVRHERWETEMDDMGWLKHTCPICGYVKRTDIHVSLGWHYCPNCGAKMDGGSI